MILHVGVCCIGVCVQYNSVCVCVCVVCGVRWNMNMMDE